MTTFFRLLIYKLKRPYHLVKTGLWQGLPARYQFGWPDKKLKIIAVTGTDGKTTTATLVYHMLLAGGIKAGLLSTVGIFLGSHQEETGLHVTSPQPKLLMQFLAKAVKNGYTHIVVELTSHGHYQYRDFLLQIDAAGLTNISHEHLDYHVTQKEYTATKLSILNQAKYRVILDKDREYLSQLKKHRLGKTTVAGGLSTLPDEVATAIKQRFKESYNQQNAILAYYLAKHYKVEPAQAAQAIKVFPGVIGRLEIITNTPKRVIVDFAHTPNALEKVLQNTRKLFPSGRLIVVFGCAGLRDVAKRPMMTKIACRLADQVVLTAEDPRTENIYTIIRQMKEQLTNDHNKINTIADRGRAIAFAIRVLARKGDTILICGKGHETSLCIGQTEYPWSDQQVVRDILANPHYLPTVGQGELLD